MYLILDLQWAGLFGEALEPSGDATLLEKVLSGGGLCGLTALVSAYSRVPVCGWRMWSGSFLLPQLCCPVVLDSNHPES